MGTNGLVALRWKHYWRGSEKQRETKIMNRRMGILIELIRIILIDGHELTYIHRVILKRKSTFSSLALARSSNSASFIIDRNQAYMLITDSCGLQKISVPLDFNFTLALT